MPFPIDWDLYRSKSDIEKKAYITSLTQDGCEVLMEELDFVLSHSDITSSFKSVGVFSFHYGIARNRFYLDVGREDFSNLFEPVLARVTKLFRKVVNVEDLNLYHLTLSEECAYAMLSLPSLRYISIANCELVDDSSLPPCPSIINARLFFNDPIDLSSWSFVRSCVNLRTLYICAGGDLDGIDPGAEFRGTCNPFRALERLTLKRLDWDDIEVMSLWIEGARELRLTHLKVEAGDIGYAFVTVEWLLAALQEAPLRVLVLDGLCYM